MTNSRRKGKIGELELSKELSRLFGHACRRAQQFNGNAGHADVVGLPGVFIECKRVQALNVPDAIGKAVAQCPTGEVPAVFHRRNAAKEIGAKKPPWLVTVRLDDLPSLVTKLYLAMASGGADVRPD